MADIVKLRTVIHTLLLTKCSNVYYEKAKSTTSFPYCVASINLMYGEVYNQGTLELNLVDNAQNTTALEILVKNLWSLFDHYYYIDSDISIVFYPDVVNNIDVGDKTLHQRRLLITFKTC